MSRKPKKTEDDDMVDPILDEGEDSDDDVGEPEDTAEIDFDRRRTRDWGDVDDLLEENEY